MNRSDGFAHYLADQREALLRQEQERAELRQRELATQCSPAHDPEFRIRTWERLHALRLPTSPVHALVRVIARGTALTIADVHHEQERRAAAIQ